MVMVAVKAFPMNIQSLFGGQNGQNAPVIVDIIMDQQPCKSFKDGMPIKGSIIVHSAAKNRINVTGINIELIGKLEVSSCKNPLSINFCYVNKSLPIIDSNNYPFTFKSPELPYNTYNGVRAKVRYYLKCTVTKDSTPIYKELDILVLNTAQGPPIPVRPLNIDVGIEDCLHIDVRLDRNAINLNGQILGHVHFLVVKLVVKHMEINILRTEIVGGILSDQSSAEGQLTHETTPVFRYELMDGTPGKGEIVPIRMNLRNVPVGPTEINVANNFSVRYFLSVVIVDESDRRYFKKQEVWFYRSEQTPEVTETAFEIPEGCLHCDP
ncbi:putative vacuolar protein sorting-associated protein 26 [Gregarina niphandrodes]|uniref:Vacuolar protein sorting-associated protein 26 n=1 Tax=Gregarina niphandrodes TaxID=110365 RepID=A0A023B4G8_GRENI|nr:putative vacuolar protein sorting-associated protein 26 [Gregarina niphandrodes]EZG56713.1 putative vacuolar protein sorting-associated protein 26 [Gregarina niphandrodes]|eukprot:XP_011131181.1 putative vacuolar protein sorting-associated protein 26 [Gregarina niphandrodes]